MAKKFNLEDYDTVQSRVQKFYKDVSDGRIITDLHESSTAITAVFRASIYIGDTLVATGWASEDKDMAPKKSKSGFEYESVNFSSHLENAETSSIGRALANMGRHGDKRASREEMQAVERAKATRDSWLIAIDKKFSECKCEQDVIKATEFILGQNNITPYKEYVKEKGQKLITGFVNKGEK